MPAEAPALIVPEAFSPRIANGFDRWYLRGLFARSWHAVRAAPGTVGVLRSLSNHAGPAMVLLNHQAWWDPLVGLWLHGRFEPNRRAIAPMEAAQLEKFGFFRKLGVFGIDPDAPRAVDALVSHVAARWIAHPTTTLWLTPQGTFVDVRTPVRLRPGAAAVAARAVPAGAIARLKVFAVAAEYVFALDRKPELCLRACEVPAPDASKPSTADWNRAMTAAMQDNARALAELVTARDWSALPALEGDGTQRVRTSRMWDWWLALRGKRGAIEATQRGRPDPTGATGHLRDSNFGRQETRL